MENTAKNIQEILKNDIYIIPRYQRNYAWGKPEIAQLIKDIQEFFSGGNNEKKYYLGSLVCFKRENGYFELIDGQQRHTTLTLINLVLKNWEENKSIGNTVDKPNLKFDSRKKIQNYIGNLYQTEKSNFQNQISALNISGTDNFKTAIEIIQEELRNIKDIPVFADNFYNNVYLFRVEVPQDTDLNHYFEIMNNRGEQLEKHEIVKASLLGKIEKEEQGKFAAICAAIWDACADMSNYVFFNFDKPNRKNLFTEKSELIATNFDEIFINGSADENSKSSLADIITQHNIPKDFSQEEKSLKDKYKSVIDFPNFLLQVLKFKYADVSLDDKKLVEQFNEIKPDPKAFIFDLLKYRTLFDEFVIKKDLADADETKQNWGIRKLNADFETTIKTFVNETENDEELVHLQVMLHYADSTNTYNNWLQEILKNTNFNRAEYTQQVLGIAKAKFQEKNDLSYSNIRIFDLYFIDFLLWKLYNENIKGKEIYTDDDSDKLNELKKKIFKHKSSFDTFKFKQLNSREHLFPQSKAKDFEVGEEDLNGIGNLCLISTSQNSAGNNDLPTAKKKSFEKDNSSLKRLIMFASFEGDKWETDQIKKHKTEIDALIKFFLEPKA